MEKQKYKFTILDSGNDCYQLLIFNPLTEAKFDLGIFTNKSHMDYLISEIEEGIRDFYGKEIPNIARKYRIIQKHGNNDYWLQRRYRLGDEYPPQRGWALMGVFNNIELAKVLLTEIKCGVRDYMGKACYEVVYEREI